MHLAPNQLIVLLDVARGFNKERHDLGTTDEDLRKLLNQKLICKATDGFEYQVTPMGRAHCNLVTDLSIPTFRPSEPVSEPAIGKIDCADPEQHKAHHKTLHEHLDELAADYIWQNEKPKMLSNTTILELLNWSCEQTKNPTTRK
jgi:hypothetical protein